MTKIKICGVTNKVDAITASGLGVDMLGFVLYNKSKRYVDPSEVEDIINELSPKVSKVGVFVNEDKNNVIKIAEDALLDTLQFHGDETPEYCSYFRPKYKVIKAFRLKTKADLKKVNDYDVDYYLFDTYQSDCIGGTGKRFDWTMLKDFELLKPVILSGGLDPDNVKHAIKEVSPFAVDVSSGVESAPGKKDAKLLKKFVENVRKAE
ncbi:MAG: phosphoribosylanthranilate isomerase [Candidatus Omnitrophica bacterium]|nr:phosphoribosylanthranilate isomerase [Candidatus Omnitrophota bacterium]